jgi:hypothetical protein
MQQQKLDVVQQSKQQVGNELVTPLQPQALVHVGLEMATRWHATHQQQLHLFSVVPHDAQAAAGPQAADAACCVQRGLVIVQMLENCHQQLENEQKPRHLLACDGI